MRIWVAESKDMDFQGLTRKEAKNNMPTDGKYKLKGVTINEKWAHWNEASEEYLAPKRRKNRIIILRQR